MMSHDMHRPSTDEDRSDRFHSGTLLMTSSIIAALGSFLFGFDTAVISGTTESLRDVYSLSDNLLGFTVSSALIGTLFGAVLVGRPADWWGRRPVLTVLAFFYLVSAVGCAYAWNWHSLLFFRWIGGIAVGGASVVSPVYITEIAPARRRGLLVAVSQLNIVVGILMAYLSNYLVAYVLGPEHPAVWRWMFGVEAVPAAVFLVASILIPESPRWLMKKGNRAAAEEVLTRFGHEAPQREVDEIEQSLTSERIGGHQSLLHRKYLKPLLLAGMIAAFNQLDGINAVIYYTADIFRMAGADKAGALMQSVIIGLTNLVMTVLAMVLIDRVGRKALLLAGSVTFILSHGLAAWVFHTHAQGWIVIVAMMGIVGSHAYSQGAVVWVCINELLPNAIRASGSAAACFLIWLLCIGVSWAFPVVARNSGAPAFAFFAVMMLVQFVLVLKYLPETKGISLEQLQKRLGVGE
ncbi:MAG: sugar porter family MFS transporter [Sedimentisphaerales bacterium]|jgi:sugar porter (SP) family MFS transporter|nr:sugar porter family MFS transporter [Planctomycetota bacterium]MDY0356091.1 sugar porter family MFS transporter [Sedimentisphaerales bacterium]